MDLLVSEIYGIIEMLRLLLPGLLCCAVLVLVTLWYLWITDRHRHRQIPRQQQVCPRCGNHLH